jgi:hypothetical protein
MRRCDEDEGAGVYRVWAAGWVDRVGVAAVSEEQHVFFACGCTADPATGIPILTCRRHDQRTGLVKASAALQQMANSLDEASHLLDSHDLADAAKYAVRAAKCLIGTDDD